MEEFKDFMKKEFNLNINSDNEEIFLCALETRKDCQNREYNFEVLALRGDALLGFFVCEKYIQNKQYQPSEQMKKYVNNDNLIEIFDNLKLERFIKYNTSNEIGDKNKSDCIEALIYAVYKSFGFEESFIFLENLYKIIEFQDFDNI